MVLLWSRLAKLVGYENEMLYEGRNLRWWTTRQEVVILYPFVQFGSHASREALTSRKKDPCHASQRPKTKRFYGDNFLIREERHFFFRRRFAAHFPAHPQRVASSSSSSTVQLRRLGSIPPFDCRNFGVGHTPYRHLTRCRIEIKCHGHNPLPN